MHLDEGEVEGEVVGEEPGSEGHGGRLEAAGATVILHKAEGCTAALQRRPHRLLHSSRVPLRTHARTPPLCQEDRPQKVRPTKRYLLYEACRCQCTHTLGVSRMIGCKRSTSQDEASHILISVYTPL